MTNNNIKEQILSLFPDNNEYSISAEDMRIYIEAIFNDKEVKIVKIASSSDIAFNNSNIYEGSLVIIYKGITPKEVGLYLSKANQPIDISQLIRISSTPSINDLINVDDAKDGDILVLQDGIWISKSILENAQYKIELENLFKEAENLYFKEIIYDEDNISQINIYTNDSKEIYLFKKDLSYDSSNNIISILITDILSNNTLSKSLNYDNDNNIISIYSEFTRSN